MSLRVDPMAGRIACGGTGPLLGVIGLLLFVAGASLTWVLWSGDHGAWLPALIALAGLLLAGYRS